MASKINLKHKAILDRYFGNGPEQFNATRSYMAVYPKASYWTAAVNVSRIFDREEVQSEIEERFKAMHVSKDEGLAILASHARAKPGDFADILEDGENFRLNLLDEEGNPKSTTPIKKLKITKKTFTNKRTGEIEKDVTTEFELYDSQAAIDKIFRVQDAYNDSLDITTGGKEIGIDDEKFDRAISTLSDAIREGLSGKGAKQNGDMGSAK